MERRLKLGFLGLASVALALIVCERLQSATRAGVGPTPPSHAPALESARTGGKAGL